MELRTERGKQSITSEYCSAFRGANGIRIFLNGLSADKREQPNHFKKTKEYQAA